MGVTLDVAVQQDTGIEVSTSGTTSVSVTPATNQIDVSDPSGYSQDEIEAIVQDMNIDGNE